ncbi:MAG: HAMP domain-containing histidine kinase, partial [Microscillaceae bacterium]|nr:HAMP domain-containing histidine kinase [Microscillaceae bacterium]
DTVKAQRDDLIEKTNELEALTEELRQQGEVLANTNANLQNTQQLKDLMISAVNHDLRNPLNPILNFSKPNYPKYSDQERLALIHQQANSMLFLIEDIMNVYRADKLIVQPAPNSLHKVATEAIQLISLAKAVKPAIRNEIPAELMAHFDHNYIKRVFENFLSNAVKYTQSEEKGGWVRFFAEVKADTQQVFVGVEDNGKGIPKDKFEEIFLPFVNLDGRSLGGAKAVGIGLTFCKNIVEAHGSKIELESEEGKGTKFYFVLPYIAPEPKAATPEEAALQIIRLTEAEKAELSTQIAEIQQIGFNNAKLKRYLEHMEVGSSERLQAWKEALMKARLRKDKEAFEEMIK